MALNDCDITFSFPEISSVAEDRENSNCDDQVNCGENYILSAPSSPENESLVHTNDVLVNKLFKQAVVSHAIDNSESNSTTTHPSSFGLKREPQTEIQNEPKGKNISRNRARNGHTNSVQDKTISKSQTSSKITRSTFENSRSKLSQKSDKNGDPMKNSESKLFVPALKLLKCQKEGSMKSKFNLDLFAAPETTVSTTSTLLSMIAHAVSTPQYTSTHTHISSTASDYPACPTRNSWPLLREMIATPPVIAVSISPAPRQSLSTVKVEPANEEEPKARVVSKLEKEIKCECKFNKGQPCWFLFQEDRLRKERLHHLTLKRESLDLVILAKIAANINREEKVKKCHGRDRQRCRVCYYHEGRQICRETFMFIHGICKGRLCALMQHYKTKGLSIRIHGNKANIPHHALSDEDSDRVLDFIREYANSHCLSTFGRKRGSKAGGGLLIMSPAQSKLYVHHKYKLWCSENKHRVVSLRSFQNLWTNHLPYIVVLRGSNKTPVPDPEAHANVLDVQEDVEFADETVPGMTNEESFHLHISSSDMNTDGILKEVEVQAEGGSKQGHCDSSTQADLDCVAGGKVNRKRKSLPPRKVELCGSKQGHCDSSTQADFDCLAGGKVNRKRKSLPPRKVELSACLPECTDREFEHNQIFSESHIMHPFISGGHIDVRLGCSASDIGNSDDINVIQDTLPQLDLHHPLFNGEQHIPQTTSLSSLQSHPTLAMNFTDQQASSLQSHPTRAMNLTDQQAAVILPADKDNIYILNNKPSKSMTKTSKKSNKSLHPPLCLPPSSQLLDSYSMQCCDRFAPEGSDSHGLCDQSQSVFLSHQGPDLSSIHQLEWQTWQSYSSL